MAEGTMMSAADIAAVTNNRGYGYNDGMWGGEWFWIIIILFAFWGNNGWGNNRNNCCENISEKFIERDLFSANQNVSNTACQTQRDVLENRYTTQLGLANLQAQNQACCCETQKEILESRYTTQLGFQNAQANLSDCCCRLENAIHAEGEATRNLMQQDKIEQLREQVYTTNLALNNANLANQIVNSIIPRPAPAYPSCSPFVPSYYGFNNGCNC